MAEDLIQKAYQELGLEFPQVGKIVLVVDDEKEILDVLQALLEDTFKVYTAQSGPQAIEQIEKLGQVDLILSDQRMPGMTGIQLLSEVTRRWPETIGMILTAYSDLEPMVEAINRASVHRFLLKPWKPELLRLTVKEALEYKATRSTLRHILQALEERKEKLQKTLQDLQKSESQLLKAERLTTLGRLTAGVTHDLNNQLNVMMLLVDGVERAAHDPDLTNMAQRALDSLKSLGSMVTEANILAQRPVFQPQKES